MIKFILLISISFMLSCSAISQQPYRPYIRQQSNEPLNIEYLRSKQIHKKIAERIKFNRIKSITRNYIDTPFGNIYNEFDKNGNVTLSKINKEEINCEEYTYDSNSNIINAKYISQYDWGNYNHQYEYDKNNNLIKIITKRSDQFYEIVEYKYDSIGNLVERIENRTRDSIISKNTLSYERSGDILNIYVHTEYIDANNHAYDSRLKDKPYLLYRYKFDVKGNIIEKYSLDMRYSRDTFETFAYDVFGNIIEYEEYKIELTDKTLTRKIESTFDDNGNLIKDIDNRVRAGVISSFSYYYDKYGNNIQMDVDMIFTSSGNKTSYTSITYYDYEFYK